MKHAVAEAKRLDMEVAITFSPGWSFGGPWVPKEDQSKVLCTGQHRSGRRPTVSADPCRSPQFKRRRAAEAA